MWRGKKSIENTFRLQIGHWTFGGWFFIYMWAEAFDLLYRVSYVCEGICVCEGRGVETLCAIEAWFSCTGDLKKNNPLASSSRAPGLSNYSQQQFFQQGRLLIHILT